VKPQDLTTDRFPGTPEKNDVEARQRIVRASDRIEPL
jgi:hypothetical protein